MTNNITCKVILMGWYSCNSFAWIINGCLGNAGCWYLVSELHWMVVMAIYYGIKPYGFVWYISVVVNTQSVLKYRIVHMWIPWCILLIIWVHCILMYVKDFRVYNIIPNDDCLFDNGLFLHYKNLRGNYIFFHVPYSLKLSILSSRWLNSVPRTPSNVLQLSCCLS